MKKEKAASKRPPSFIHPLSASPGSVSNQKAGAPFGPRECVSFFPRALFSALLFAPKTPFHMCRIPTKDSEYARAREDRSDEGMGRDNPTNPDNEPDGARRHSGTD